MVKFRPLLKTVKHLPSVKGVSALDILNLPDEVCQLIRIMSNEKTMTLSAIAAHFDLSKFRTRRLMKHLIDKGYMKSVPSQPPDHQPRYRVHYAKMRKRNIPLDL